MLSTTLYSIGRLRRAGLFLGGAAALLLGAATLKASPQSPKVLNQVPPELTGGPWLNTPNQKPITLESRKGKVTLVHFWTFGCINCKRNLPIYARWHQKFAKRGVTIIGVHTPETEEEKIASNVARAVKRAGITYPVLLDQQGENWNRWQQQVWPTVYLIDKQGTVRYAWVGELEWKGAGGEAIMTRKIEELLQERS